MSMKNINPKLGWLASVSAAVLLSGCATSLANRTPLDIASNSVRRTDTVTGVSEVITPYVKAFPGRRRDISGIAQLRTAGPFTDDKGAVQRGGAYLDVTLKYATVSPDPAEMRLYNNVSWAGGEVALLAEFGAAVTDCREEIRESYTPTSYGHYGNYGYYGRGYGHGYGYGHYDDDGHGGDHDGDGDVDDDDDDMPTTPPNTGDATPAVSPPRPPNPRRHGLPLPHPDGPGTEPEFDPDLRRRGPSATMSRPVVSRRRPVPAAVSSKPAPKPTVSRPKSTSTPKSRPAAKTETRSRPSVNRTFSRTNNSRTSARKPVRREVHYYPRDPYYDTGYRSVTVRHKCDRRENLRVFIPRERLDAAEQNGLLLYLRPRAGREEVLALPTNYIAGFKLAAFSPEGQRLTIPGNAVRLSQKPKTTLPSKAEPDASAPIIYGEN